MEWIQLVLPQEGMREALLRYLEGSTLPDREVIRRDFSGWLQQRRDESLGLAGAQRWFYLAVTPEDEIVGSAVVTVGEEKFEHIIQLRPDLDEPSCREQLEQQLQDLGF